jgi:hypothetical protein
MAISDAAVRKPLAEFPAPWTCTPSGEEDPMAKAGPEARNARMSRIPDTAFSFGITDLVTIVCFPFNLEVSTQLRLSIQEMISVSTCVACC